MHFRMQKMQVYIANHLYEDLAFLLTKKMIP